MPSLTRQLSRLLAPSVLALLSGCGSSAVGAENGSAGTESSAGTSGASTSTGAGAGAGAGAGSGGATAGSGDLPCDVQALLATKCQACHSVDPPGLLLAAADFSKPSKSEPSKTVGALALERLQLTTALRMPPSPLTPATAAEIAAFSSWIQGGAKPTTCGSTPVATAPSPYDTPVVCTSMKTWTGGNRESPLMRPGGACISCHASGGEGPIFAISGTLFPTAHEPNDCNGVTSAAGAQVVITEANGTSHTLKANDAGNFFLEVPNFQYPYQAKVVYQGRERVMVEAQMDGDCNGCHTQDGAQKAPGRIFLP